MKKKLFIIGIILLLLVCLGISGFFFYRYYQAKTLIEQLTVDPTKISNLTADQQKRIVEQVGKHLELPANETPLVAIVNNIDQLKGRQLFERAQNMDYLIVYQNANKAIIYRPTIDRVIDVMWPVTFGSQTASESAAVPPAGGKWRVIVRNGTPIVGLAKKYEDTLAGKTDLTVVGRDTAARSDYRTTAISDISGTRGVVVKQIAESLGIPVVQFPAGEEKPDADFVIILGSDQSK